VTRERARDERRENVRERASEAKAGEGRETRASDEEERSSEKRETTYLDTDLDTEILCKA
jgi:hypothetical protein